MLSQSLREEEKKFLADIKLNGNSEWLPTLVSVALPKQIDVEWVTDIRLE